MKLNTDCVRDVVFCVEENAVENKKVCFFVDWDLHDSIERCTGHADEMHEYQGELNQRYSNQEVVDAVRYCIEKGVFKANGDFSGYSVIVYGLTALGRDFAQVLRSSKLGKALKKIGSFIASLAIEAEISAIVSNPQLMSLVLGMFR